jgi:hypothetical protein
MSGGQPVDHTFRVTVDGRRATMLTVGSSNYETLTDKQVAAEALIETR